jgi:alkylation response protein AidB-like acyl-CoA dehydrogenase
MTTIWEPTLDEEDSRFRITAERLTEESFAPLAEEVDRAQRYPWENVRLLNEAGLSTMFVPKEYGGGGASLSAATAVIEAVAAGCASTASILTTYQIGAEALRRAGSAEQKQRYLAETIARGQAISFCLSEAGAGSDPAGMTTVAISEGDGYRLRGEKFWVGNGTASAYYVVFAKTDPEAGTRGISGFIVAKDADGVAFDYLADKMGQRGTLTTNMKLDTWVPRTAMLGELNRGMTLALSCLDPGRITISGHAIGMGIAAFEEAARRACERQIFGKPMIEHQGVGFKLADMAMRLSAARAMTYQAAREYDEGRPNSALAAMTKVVATETANFVCNEAVQIWGSLGYVKPTKVERLLRDMRINQIYEGPSEVQRLVVMRAIQRAFS